MYEIQSLGIDQQITLSSAPKQIIPSPSNSIIAVIDVNNKLSFYDTKKNEYIEYSKSEVWNFYWGNHKETCCFMEKNKLTIMENYKEEIIVQTNSYIFDFDLIEIKLSIERYNIKCREQKVKQSLGVTY